MDSEIAHYIIKYYFKLLPTKEKIAWTHNNSLQKLSNDEDSKRLKIYLEKGWITEDQSILDLLKDGYEKFEINSAEKILLENSDKVFLNYCQNCGKIARTPYAKQCRHCNNNWH